MAYFSKILRAVAASALCLALAACAPGAGSNASQSVGEEPFSESEAVPDASLDPAVRAEIEQVLGRAREASYKNVTFSQETRTTVMGVEDGKTVTQAVLTKMDGELRRGKKKPAMHFTYETQSSTQLGKTTYDMYVDKDNVFVLQNGELYVSGMEDASLEGYMKSVVGVASEEEVSSLLDVASNYKIEHDDDTTITITADVSKIAQTNLVDTESLPEGTSIATLVANYVVGPDDRLKTVRLMSSTSGTPTYRVTQSYRFSKYDDTKLPEWPSIADQTSQDSRIQTDADGNMYIMDDDGHKYYIDSIDEDGTVHTHLDPAEAQSDSDSLIAYGDPTAVSAGQQRQSSSGGSNGSKGSKNSKGSKSSKGTGLGDAQIAEGDTSSSKSIGDPVFYEGDVTGTTGSTSTSSGGTSTSTGDSSSDQGRAYITASDGTIHYLDEPGSEIRDVGGSRVFIDANGEWYFLSE